MEESQGEKRENVTWEVREKTIKKIKYKATVTIHSYYSKFGYLQTFASFDACLFYAKLRKFLHFLYFTPTNTIALTSLL